MAFSLPKPLKSFHSCSKLKIVSIFLVWMWANISLQKSIPECLHSSSGLEACTSKCFWKWRRQGEGALQMRSHYTWWSVPCVSARFYFTLAHPQHPLFSELNPLKIIGMWKRQFFFFCFFLSVADSFATLLTEPPRMGNLYSRALRKMQTNITRLPFFFFPRNLTAGCAELLCPS